MNRNKIGYARVSTLDQSLEIQIEKRDLCTKLVKTLKIISYLRYCLL